jgi:hypothetical protein
MQQRHSSSATVTQSAPRGRPNSNEKRPAPRIGQPALRGDRVIAARCGKPANYRVFSGSSCDLEPFEPSASAVIVVAFRTLVRPYL